MNKRNPTRHGANRIKRRSLLILSLLTIIILGLATAQAKERQARDYRYKVIRVHDGDTFTATDGNIKFRVRIAAMDAPEKGQPYSKIAGYRLRKMIQDKEVEIIPVSKGVDRYGRVLGYVKLNGEDLALSLINQGLATYYRPTCKDYPADKEKYNYDPRAYIKAESKARKEKLNIWKESDFIYPCKHRRMR